MNKPHSTPRTLAVETLLRVQDGAYSNLQLNQVIENHPMKASDVNLLTTIVYGVIQRDLTLAFWLRPFLKKPEKVASWVQVLLKTAIYQWQFLERVPKRAIFDETIEISKKFGHEGIRRFVTGILHQMDREGFASFETLKDPIDRLSITYSMPTWIIEVLIKQVGAAKTESILAAVNEPANQSVRINSLKVTDQQALTQLAKAGYEVKQSAVADHALVLSGKPANQAALFQAGAVTIQDESAMLPVQAMAISPEAQVLDACAAPGGKTVQLAERVEPAKNGAVTALDIHKHKVALIEKNARRMGVLKRIKPVVLDARQVDQKFADGQFDAILVDAPCTGIGLVRRKPEIRYGKTLTDSENLAKVQQAILEAVAKKVKINGIITYSTCTILQQENRDVVANFLGSHPNFESVRVTTAHNLKADRNSDYLEIYPDDYGSDGFFISQFKRIS